MLQIRRLIKILNIQRGTGSATDVSLQMEQLISLIIPVIVYSFTSLEDSDREVIPVSEVHDVLSKHHDFTRLSLNWLVMLVIFHCFQAML